MIDCITFSRADAERVVANVRVDALAAKTICIATARRILNLLTANFLEQ